MNQKIIDLIKRMNPELNENTSKPADVVSMKQRMDVGSLDRIDSPHEFKEAFKVWFDALGFDPHDNPIRKNQIIRDIEDVLNELGYN